VAVRCKAHARNNLAALGQGRIHAKLVVIAVEVVDILSNNFALKILPRPVANAITRIDRRLSVSGLGAQICSPGLASRAMTLRQLLTMLIGTFKSAEIGALAWPSARDKECHVRRLRQLWRGLLGLLLCFDAGHHPERRERQRKQDE
jgi:hypothetical protein